ncbi:phosphopyruvate hydratase [Candidatus Bathyarchaeota archaeon]|nr:phosphopyruvate hydratase [Candidatus Bathyarchaeota archaeon]
MKGQTNAPTVIEDVRGRIIFDSRGSETLEVDVITMGGFGRAAAPAGKSVGRFEVASYPARGINHAVRQVEEVIAPELIGMNADEQEIIDNLLHEIDGTANFSNIGGNTAYAVSLAVAEAAASSRGIPLFQHLAGVTANEFPHPLGNVLCGGKHAGRRAPDIQEFLVLPINIKSFVEAVEANIKVHSEVRRLIEKVDLSFTGGKGDEGGWAPNLDNEKALELVVKACETISDETGVEVRPALDFASSTIWDAKKERYVYSRDGIERDQGQQIDYVKYLIQKYRLSYVEDPLHEEDYVGFTQLTKEVKKCLICGDDLFTTNKERLERGIKAGAGNAIIIKPNQIGTLTDAYATVKLAKNAGYIPVLSHRSGETVGAHLSHLAIAFGCPIIKTGVVGGERLAKLNELIRIEETLGSRAKVARLEVLD